MQELDYNTYITEERVRRESMNIWRLFVIVVLFSFISVAYTTTETAAEREIPRMTKEELKAKLDSKDMVIVDVRIPSDYDRSDTQIKGAVRENPMDVRYWYNYPKDKTIVLYCA
jgi:hypothetical protein